MEGRDKVMEDEAKGGQRRERRRGGEKSEKGVRSGKRGE